MGNWEENPFKWSYGPLFVTGFSAHFCTLLNLSPGWNWLQVISQMVVYHGRIQIQIFQKSFVQKYISPKQDLAHFLTPAPPRKRFSKFSSQPMWIGNTKTWRNSSKSTHIPLGSLTYSWTQRLRFGYFLTPQCPTGAACCKTSMAETQFSQKIGGKRVDGTLRLAFPKGAFSGSKCFRKVYLKRNKSTGPNFLQVKHRIHISIEGLFVVKKKANIKLCFGHERHSKLKETPTRWAQKPVINRGPYLHL